MIFFSEIVEFLEVVGASTLEIFVFLFVINIIPFKVLLSGLPDDILKIIKFSEYEVMNPRLAGQEEAEEITRKIFENVKAKSIASNSYLASIKEKNMELYYILDL